MNLIVTGARSPLGGYALRRLSAGGAHRVVAVASPRTVSGADAAPGVEWIAEDLRSPPSASLRAELERADLVLHFAWTRIGAEPAVSRENRAMISGLLGGLPDPARFWLISSVSASPDARSAYGRTKHEATALVRDRGGGVLACGLVVEPNPTRGPYRLLRRVVRSAPLSLRTKGDAPSVFPLRMADLGACMDLLARGRPAPGIYRMFSEPLPFNRFMERIEALEPRARATLRFNAAAAVRAAGFAQRAHLLPEKLCEQVRTFLHKDEAHLLSHAKLPGFHPLPCEGAEFFH